MTAGVIAVGLLVLSAAIIGTLLSQTPSSSVRPFGAVLSAGTQLVPLSAPSTAPGSGEISRGEDDHASTGDDGAVTEVDGVLPDGVTVFDDEYPGVADLDPDLLRALREAARQAHDAGIELYVKSGWRSRDYQDELLREAVSRYGSKEQAAQWVATADTSPHVSGDAVDIGSADATTWLSAHGAAYGLCQIYRNEPWHFELRPRAIGRGCPRMYADPTRDPRMRS